MGSTINLISEDETEPLEELTSWNCPQCTYKNTPIYLVCEVCGLERPSTSPSIRKDTTAAAQAEYSSPAPKPPQAAAPPASPLLNNTSWTCQICTLVNGGTTPACDACGAPAPWVINDEDENAAGPSTSTRQPRTQPEPALAASQDEPGVYTLDCGCCVPLQDAKSVLNKAVAQLSSSHAVPALLQLFRCPGGVLGGKCSRYLTHRDLEALVGAQTAATIDRQFYSTAANSTATSRNEVDSVRHCGELARSIAELHSAVISSTGEATATNTNAQIINGRKRKSGASSKRGGGSGVGYGGGGSARGTGYGGTDDRAARQGLEAAAAQRQHSVDEHITHALRAVRSALTAMLRAEENLAFSSISPIGWLPLGAVAVLLGSPLAACLRLLLCNDSLMDITGRKELYAEALQLLTTLASKQELIPLLLKPADGDVLAEFARDAEQQQRPPKKKSRSVQKQDGDASGSGSLSGLDRSCWKALQAFQLQCQLFLQNAEALANEGSEEDLGNVGTVILVQETCKAVDEAVEAWKALTKAAATTAAAAPANTNPTAAPQQQQMERHTALVQLKSSIM